MELFGRILTGAKDTLEGYKIALIEITDEAFLERGEEKFQQTLARSNHASDAVAGTVFEISREELSRADKYEPENYKRIKVTLSSGKAAWIYVAGEIKSEKSSRKNGLTGKTHDCPICSAQVEHRRRYPNQVCERCQSRTADAYGRRIKFTNAGLRAVYLDHAEEEYTRQLCYIDGRKCFVGEHRFGGIVVEVVKN